jgi:hypothetical protein
MSPVNVEVGLSGSSSSAADSGHSTFGDFIIGGGKNTMSVPGWVWLVAVAIGGLIVCRMFAK